MKHGKIKTVCLDKDLSIYQTSIIHPKIKVKLLNIGASIQSLWIKDKIDQWQDIVLGYKSHEEYLSNNTYYLGSVHAVLTNRIANGKFKLDNQMYQLECNENNNSLHIGDIKSKIWQQSILESDNTIGINYSLKLENKFAGLPGPMEITVKYLILLDGTLQIDYLTRAYENTILSNLTNHSYFNLNGTSKHKLLGHSLQLNASKYLSTNNELIPDGNLLEARDIFDFSKPKLLNECLESSSKRLADNEGYDLFYILNKNIGKKGYELAARLSSSQSGISMSLYTTYPGLQLYTANHLKNCSGKYNQIYNPHEGICLETHHYPDAPNHINFPSISTPAYTLTKSSSRYIFSCQSLDEDLNNLT